MAIVVKSFDSVPDEFTNSLPERQVKVGLMFSKEEDEKTDDGVETVSFDASKPRSGVMLVRVGDGKYAGSAVEFSGVFFDQKGQLRGPILRTIGMMVLKCPRCGDVVVSGSDLVRAAKRAGVSCDSAKEAIRLHGVCPNCKLNKVSEFRYLDVAGEEGEAVYGKENLDRLKGTIENASSPFVIPPVVALVADPNLEGAADNDIPSEFPELVTELIRRAASYTDEDGPYPMKVCDIAAFTKDKGHVANWQLVMPECYGGFAAFDAVDQGIKIKDGLYKVDLQVFLKKAAGIDVGKRDYAQKEAGKRRRPPRFKAL